MKPAMTLRQEQKDGCFQLFHRMYTFKITQGKHREEVGGGERGTEWGMIELVLRNRQSCDLFLNFPAL